LAHDRMREPQDLSAVHHFYINLVQDRLGHEIPLPDVDNVTLLRRWLNLLDLAVTPVMVRDALKERATPQTAESLLRFYVGRESPEAENRDKTDFVATHLYRTWRKDAKEGVQPEHPEEIVYQASAEASDCERDLRRLLGDVPIEEMPQEMRKVASEFGHLRAEVSEFRDFDRMMDSGVVQRARQVKQLLGPYFYHPAALAAMATYNAYFGRHFDKLFRMATEQIKGYATRVQEEGGSLLSRVEGDVILKDLAEVEEKKILSQEYARAQEEFRRVSRYKKAVESKKRHRGPEEAPATPGAPATAGKAGLAGGRESSRALQDEETQTRMLLEEIRTFTQNSGSGPVIMPLRNRNLILTAPEADAFRADYNQESSFRGQYVTALMQCVTIQARMAVESDEYQKHKGSTHLWKGSADALDALVTLSQGAIERGEQLIGMAEARGLEDKRATLRSALDKLHYQCQNVTALLQRGRKT
jgi:hypothetical protein